MKKLIYITLAGAMMAFSSCQSSNNQAATDEECATVDKATITKSLVDNNTFIDLDIDKHSNELIQNYAENRASRASEATETDDAKLHAILYRFYSHVKLVDGCCYEVSISSPEEINVSQRVFDYLMAEIEDSNNFMKEAIERGDRLYVSEINDEYLNCLLEHKTYEPKGKFEIELTKEE